MIYRFIIKTYAYFLIALIVFLEPSFNSKINKYARCLRSPKCIVEVGLGIVFTNLPVISVTQTFFTFSAFEIFTTSVNGFGYTFKFSLSEASAVPKQLTVAVTCCLADSQVEETFQL